MSTKRELYAEEKTAIARKAASLVKPHDFVYLDAGSTTLRLIDFLNEKAATYVTNGISHAAHLAARGCKVFILGGQLKALTEAITGTEALANLDNYNFTKGFFGTNGISPKSGFSTPDSAEGIIKGAALIPSSTVSHPFPSPVSRPRPSSPAACASRIVNIANILLL